MRFLLVDDDRADAGLLVEAMLQVRPAAKVDVARTADEAMERLRHAPRPSLVLLDLNMPGEGGFDVLRRMRSDPATVAVPVVVLTTSAARADIQMAYALHANAFVTKPPDLHSTVAALATLCDFWCDLAVLP